MRTMALRRLSTALLLSLIGLAPVAAFERIGDGIFLIDAASTDDLLSLNRESEVRVLVLEQKNPKALSDAHLNLARKWVEAGGILWVAVGGLESVLATRVAPFNVEPYKYKKTSTGNTGGELVVKDASPRLRIGDHALTDGVTQLYLFPRYKFDGTLNAVPLVEITDIKGNHGLILAAIPVGQGFLILDGTSRKEDLLVGRMRGFEEKHPNSLKQGKGRNSYDWPRLWQNARSLAEAALGASAE